MLLEHPFDRCRVEVALSSHVLAGEAVERDDVGTPCLERSTALATAPDAAPEAGLFRVPRVIG